MPLQLAKTLPVRLPGSIRLSYDGCVLLPGYQPDFYSMQGDCMAVLPS